MPVFSLECAEDRSCGYERHLYMPGRSGMELGLELKVLRKELPVLQSRVDRSMEARGRG